MSRQNLNKKKLDEIGRILIKTDSVRRVDVDNIVSRPGLFDSVRTRIALNEPAAVTPARLRSKAVALAGAAVVIATVVFAVGRFSSGTAELAAREYPASPIAPRARAYDSPDSVAEPLQFTTAAPLVPRDSQMRGERISVKQIANTRQKRPAAEIAPEGEFYALSYAGDPNETDRGGRIIRVDMPRSTLFAMGVNIPLENEAEVVKTDLLIGPDGVTRAIRVVR